ncbi:MAG: AtpZ/AtpI family protein [Pseudomonadota bacterium]
MGDDSPDREPSLDALRHRLSEAKAKQARGRGAQKGSLERSEGMAAGFRVAVELTAALVVGGGIGYVLDRWLGTQPWLLIVFFMVGAAAGFLTIYRTGQELDARARQRREAEAADEKADGDRKSSGG